MRLEGYSNYEIYPETGQIWSYTSNKFIGHKDYKNGYWYCTLYNDSGERINWRLHRFIWVAVNGAIPEGIQVNHIDENIENNSITNLSLMTAKENSNWGTRTQRIISKTTNGKCSKGIIALQNNNVIRLFPSMMEAERNGFSAGNICNCCKGKLKIYKGYQWKYLDDILGDWLEEIQDEDMKQEKVA